MRYAVVDERLKSGSMAGQVLRRYIIKVLVKPKNDAKSFEKSDIVLCNWPSCMHKTRQINN